MNITFRQMSVFEATARLGRITQAASELSMTQSAASQSLKELESILGYTVFNRIGRELAINEEGRSLLPKVLHLLELHKELKNPVSKAIQGNLIVAASVTIGSYLMPKLLAGFIAENPLVEPRLYIGNSDDVMFMLEHARAHIGLIEGHLLNPSLEVFPWRTDHLDVFCHPEHPLADTSVLTSEQMSQQRWILRESGSGTRSVFISAIQKLGVKLEKSMDLTRQEAIKQAVKAGLGIGCLSEMAIKDEIKSGIFSILNTELDLSRQLSIVQSSFHKSNRLVSAFFNYLQHNIV